MRIDLSDLDRLESFAYALGRLFWCLMVVAFFAAILGSSGTGLLEGVQSFTPAFIVIRPESISKSQIASGDRYGFPCEEYLQILFIVSTAGS